MGELPRPDSGLIAMTVRETAHYLLGVIARVYTLPLRAYRPARWIGRFLLAGALLPWIAGFAVWISSGTAMNTGDGSIAWPMIFAAAWNYLLAAVISPVALMMVSSTRQGPITWHRLSDQERRIFAMTMLSTFCTLTLILAAMVWRANHGSIIPVMLTSFLVTMVGTLAGVLMATAIVATRHMHRVKRVKAVPHASFHHHHHHHPV